MVFFVIIVKLEVIENFICLCCIQENRPFASLSDKTLLFVVIKRVKSSIWLIGTLINTIITDTNRFIETFAQIGTVTEDRYNAVQPPECNYYITDKFQISQFDTRSFSIL